MSKLPKTEDQKKKEDNIAKASEKMFADNQEISTVPRFGFFSIIPNPVLGDGHYSMNNEYHHQVVDRKVITDRRGIYTTPGKTGKGKDAYFDCMDRVEENEEEIKKKGWEEEAKNHLDRVQLLKKRPVTAVFKYPGVQEHTDYFALNPVERNGPLYTKPPKHYKVTKDHKVIVENRGIYTSIYTT